MKRTVAFLLGLTAVLPAMADVIYRWHSVWDAPDMPSFDAVLRITDEAFWRGSAFIDHTGCAGAPCLAAAAADAGIVYMEYSFALGSHGHQPPLDIGVYDKFDLRFDTLGRVSGTISYNTTEVELGMSGLGLWTVDLLRGDPYMGTACGGPTYCSGATGYFQAERLPVRIPEPASLALMAVGAGMLAAVRRKVIPASLAALRHAPCATGSA